MFGIQLIYGPFPFMVDTAAYDELSRSSRWNWQSVDRVGELPALQFTGPQNDTITLNGRLCPPFTGGMEQMSRMRFIADFGRPLPLIDGTGRVLGLWVVESIDETGTKHFRDGYPRMIMFNLTLKYYGDGTGIFGRISKLSKLVSLLG